MIENVLTFCVNLSLESYSNARPRQGVGPLEILTFTYEAIDFHVIDRPGPTVFLWTTVKIDRQEADVLNGLIRASSGRRSLFGLAHKESRDGGSQELWWVVGQQLVVPDTSATTTQRLLDALQEIASIRSSIMHLTRRDSESLTFERAPSPPCGADEAYADRPTQDWRPPS